mmetsp:Transcript_11621/g.31680  ORF Transcript_11621/g.31680 Transcript_11621/m.31680 type:complete len:214 (+) Transcript_11621:844-1485(+)
MYLHDGAGVHVAVQCKAHKHSVHNIEQQRTEEGQHCPAADECRHTQRNCTGRPRLHIAELQAAHAPHAEAPSSSSHECAILQDQRGQPPHAQSIHGIAGEQVHHRAAGVEEALARHRHAHGGKLGQVLNDRIDKRHQAGKDPHENVAATLLARLLHGLSQQAHESEDGRAQAQGSQGGTESMAQRAQSPRAALGHIRAGSRVHGAKVPLCYGA